MRRAVILLAVLLAASPAAGAVRNCSAALVTAGLCQSATDVLVSFSLSTTDPDGAGPRVSLSTQFQEGCALYFQYQTTVNGVANPESKAAFCDRRLKEALFAGFSRLYYSQAAQAAYDSSLASTPLDAVP